MNTLAVQTATELPLEIKTYDIDVAGHVNNIVYVQWLEDLRTALFEKYFHLQELLAHHLYPIVLSTEISYRRYLKLFDKPVGTMCVECSHHGILTLKAEVKLNGKIAVSGIQKCALFDLCKLEIIKGQQLQEILLQNCGMSLSAHQDSRHDNV